MLEVKHVSKNTNQYLALPACISEFREMIFVVDKYLNCVQNQHINKLHVPKLEFEQEPVESGLRIWQLS